MIEQGYNYVNSTVEEITYFFETRVCSLEPKKSKDMKILKNHKMGSFDSSIEESSEESYVERWPNNKYFLHGKSSHSPHNCKDLLAMINKHNQKKRGTSCLTERGV